MLKSEIFLNIVWREFNIRLGVRFWRILWNNIRFEMRSLIDDDTLNDTFKDN